MSRVSKSSSARGAAPCFQGASNKGLLLGAAAGLLLSACGSSTDDSGSGFQLVKISVANDQVWQINRAIRMEFNEEVNFNTVNGNSISIAQAPASGQVLPGVPGGKSALGTFVQINPKTVEFRPTCPQQDDYSDAGFEAGQIVYNLEVLGKDAGIAVGSKSGKVLQTSQTRTFKTPGSTQPFVPSEIFLDTVPGAPLPAKDVNGEQRTYLELGGDPLNRIIFNSMNVGSDGVLMETQQVNLYSDISTRVVAVLELNQSVDPSSININSNRVGLQFRPITTPETLVWAQLPTTVELVKNCSDIGATLRLTPNGPLPQGSEVRVVISSEFSDLVGEKNALPLTDDFIFRTVQYDFPSLTPSSDMADELFEPFVASGDAPFSIEDPSPPFADPLALWGDGKLQANFDFTGTGGPGGDFDFKVFSNTEIKIETSGTTVVQGGPNFVPSKNQTVIGGILNVRDLLIEDLGLLTAVGSNPLVIQATGDVTIYGTIVADGGDAPPVATLNTGNIPEPGASGQAGGGKGGDTSWLTTTSTPQGQNGAGAFNVSNLGGRGGESGYGTGNKNSRRPGGGGGGVFGADSEDPFFPWGMVAEPGENGNPNATGAVTGMQPPQGGAFGPTVFIDEDPDNNYWGNRVVSGELTKGELAMPLAGTGGGGGGDAIPAPSFPHPTWGVGTDEKGGPGAGGGGQIQILALGEIHIVDRGQVTANGGNGASGENTIGTDHLGGGGGGGSGGHIILQTPRKIFIDMHDALYDGGDVGVPATNNLRALVARGGRGGQGESGFNSTNAGGDGGPGLIQLHVREPELDIVFDPAVIPNAEHVSEPPPIVLVPTFGEISRAQSKWIPLAGATFSPAEGGNPPGESIPDFYFEGTDTTTGRVEKSVSGVVTPNTPVLSSATAPIVSQNGKTLVVDATVLANTTNDIYLRNPRLLRNFRLTANGGFSTTTIVAAENDPTDFDNLVLTLQDNIAVAAYDLIPRYFEVVTSSAVDSLPPNSFIQILFQGTPKNALGQPDETDGILGPWTADIADLSDPAEKPYQYFRFQVEFNIDENQNSLDGNTPRPQLDFLRMPFRF